MPYRAMKFKSVSVGIHMVCRSMSYGSPRMGNRASGMHGRSVLSIPVLHVFGMKLMTRFRSGFIMTVQRTFYLLLCLRKAHAAIGGFTDSR